MVKKVSLNKKRKHFEYANKFVRKSYLYELLHNLTVNTVDSGKNGPRQWKAKQERKR